MNSEYLKTFEIFKNAKKVAIVGHIQPDGDALGCALALQMFFVNNKKQADVYFEGIVRKQFNYLKGWENIISDTSALNESLKYDLLIIVDSSSEERLGKFTNLRNYCKKVIVIDHHLDTNIKADFSIVVPSASSVGEILYEIFKSGNEKITPDMANALYTAVSTDTGCFLYPSTTTKTHRIAADLIDMGADIEKINYQNFRIYNYKLVGDVRQVLRDLRFVCNGKIAYVRLKNGRSSYDQDERHKIQKYVSDAEGVMVSIFVTSDVRNEYHISLRSHGDINVADVAQKFGGGGHKNAAGFIMNGRFKKVIKAILLELEKALENNKA